MAVFTIEKSEGVWFDYPGGGRVKLRVPTTEDFFRIHKESVENRPYLHEEEGKPPRVLNYEVPDNDKAARLTNDCTIIEWENFFFDEAKKKPIPCTPENKTALMRMTDPSFRDFVNDKVKALDEAQQAKVEAETKNLSTSPSGDPA
jgi:hypothetical protein